ncbi:MAG: WecB/TagA/CpsF family glycosyltransferase [Candidatus Zixiibacteriota bacterium]|nr:MAG: WecB/TagA/CpsF family glycosyltransferase [candidate division Zixibacteria bacterium]
MDKIELFGCPVDSLNLDQTVRRIEVFIRKREPRRHSALNAAKIVRMRKDESLRQIVEASDVVSADGQSVVWASRLLGKPLPERVAGIDLMQKLLRMAETRGYRIYLLGGTEEVVIKLKEVLGRQHPGLNIVGWRNGYFSSREEDDIVEEINAKGPDILFVGMSTPKKEYFLGKYKGRLRVPFCMGVGGSFDVLSGKSKRAPYIMRRMGLEWFYRFVQEPTRLWKRYLTTNTLFLFYLLQERIRQSPRRKTPFTRARECRSDHHDPVSSGASGNLSG